MAAPPIIERHKPHFHRKAPWLEPVRAATTANITISTALNNGDTLDGITLATDDRVLVKDQSTASQNGVYVVAASPARDYDLSTDDPNFGFLVYVKQGTTNGGKVFRNTNTSAPTVGSTSITFSEFSAGVTDHGALTGLADDDHSAYVLVYGGGEETVSAHGSTGSTETINPASGNWHTLTLDADCTLTLTAPTNSVGCSLVLEVTQDGTGGRDLIFPASVANKTELEAAQDQTASSTSFLTLMTRNGGTTWYGFWAGGGSASPLTTKGDLWGYDTADARVPVGTNGYVLTADSTDAQGVSWQANAGTGYHYELLMAAGITSPPEPLETAAGDDWLYALVPD